MSSPSLVSPLKSPYPVLPSPAHQPTHSCFLALHSPILGHRTFIGWRASPPTDDQLGHPLLHMHLEPWVPPWVFFGWWFSPRELCRYWLVHTVVPPTGPETPSSPSVISLPPSLGILCTFQWIAVNIHFCICEALTEHLRRQLYQALDNKLF